MVYFKGVVDSRSAERRAPGAGKIEDSERKKERGGGSGWEREGPDPTGSRRGGIKTGEEGPLSPGVMTRARWKAGLRGGSQCRKGVCGPRAGRVWSSTEGRWVHRLRDG